MNDSALTQLTATERLKHRSEISCQSLMDAYLARIAEREPVVQAWHYLNAEAALHQAIACDTRIARGEPVGPLLGLPIAIKDNFATADMPTGWGTPIHDGTQLGYDAAVVERLRSAGAIPLGKTVLTEYAIARAGKTTNPHHPLHTPGGSSSGSAAAVAAGMVPVAIGSQTVGSVLRPAAYCGILGFKPSFGRISRYGLLPLCRELDHVGVFARSLEDMALLLSVLVAPDDRDPDGWGGHWEMEGAIAPGSTPPRLALIRGPLWPLTDTSTQRTVEQSAAALATAGATVETVDLPPMFDDHLAVVDALVCAGAAVNLGPDYDSHPDQISAPLQALIQQGRTASPLAYAQARQTTVAYRIALAAILADYDAILTPVTTGAAPYGLEGTGSSMFCALWSLCGLPALSLPAGTVDPGLPMAVQLVGHYGTDERLLAIARWVKPVLDDWFYAGRTESVGRVNT